VAQKAILIRNPRRGTVVDKCIDIGAGRGWRIVGQGISAGTAMACFGGTGNCCSGKGEIWKKWAEMHKVLGENELRRGALAWGDA